jgi:uncharacterized protein involved in exopolysaccharide biosynthesis
LREKPVGSQTTSWNSNNTNREVKPVASRERDSSGSEGAVDLIGLWRLLSRYRVLIAITSAVFALAAVVVALTMTPIYRAEVVIAEVSDIGMNDASSLVSQLGGLSTLIGINLPISSGAGRESKAILESRRLAEEFIRHNDLVPEIPPKSKRPPTLWFSVKYLRENVLSITDDPRKGKTTVAIEWRDPAIAAQWANAYVALANELIRTRAIDDAKRNIAYLNEQVALSNVVQIQELMYKLIEAETKKLMLANGRPEYAFTVVDPAVTPELRVRPRRTFIAFLGLALGFLVGTSVACLHSYMTAHRAGRFAGSHGQ